MKTGIKLSRKEKRELRKLNKANGTAPPPRSKVAKEELRQATEWFWVVTANHPKTPARQVYPNEEEAGKYADKLRKRKGFKDITIEQGRPR